LLFLSCAKRFRFHDDQQDIAEPLKVADLFLEKRTGKPHAGIPYVPSKDVDTARELPGQLSFTEINEFIDYALNEARKTKIEVQTLGGLKQYLAEFKERRIARVETAAAKGAQDREEQQAETRIPCDRFRPSAASEIRTKSPFPVCHWDASYCLVSQLNHPSFRDESAPMALKLAEASFCSDEGDTPDNNGYWNARVGGANCFEQLISPSLLRQFIAYVSSFTIGAPKLP
jgi:hypothetical protein